jgi:hypothetical protein
VSCLLGREMQTGRMYFSMTDTRRASTPSSGASGEAAADSVVPSGGAAAPAAAVPRSDSKFEHATGAHTLRPSTPVPTLDDGEHEVTLQMWTLSNKFPPGTEGRPSGHAAG